MKSSLSIFSFLPYVFGLSKKISTLSKIIYVSFYFIFYEAYSFVFMPMIHCYLIFMTNVRSECRPGHAVDRCPILSIGGHAIDRCPILSVGPVML